MYKLSSTGEFIRMSDGAFIPADLGNEDYIKYLDWAKTNTALPADIIPITYQPLSAWQVRKVLTKLGLRTQVEGAIAASTDQNTKDAWNYANDFQRNDVLLNSMGTALGLTSAQLDNLFTVGITL